MKISSAVAFATSIAVRVHRRQQECVEAALLALGDEQRLTASIAANSSVTVKTPAASWPESVFLFNAKWKIYENVATDKQRHRRKRLVCVRKFEQQVLAQVRRPSSRVTAP